MVLRRYMALLLLCVTSFHVLVTDVASHERVPVTDGQELTAALDQPDQNAGAEHHGGAQHCCQCHGFMASPAVEQSARAPLPVLADSRAPALPVPPSSSPYRPPIV